MSSRKEKIAQIATDSIKRDGYRNLSFRQLADEVGVKSSSVHYHFPAKADLAHALIQEYTEQFAQRLRTIKQSNPGLRDRLDALVTVFEEALLDQRLCLCGMMAAELTSLDDQSRAALRTFFAELESWVCQVAEEQSQALLLPLQPQQFAQVLVAGLEGAMLLDRVDAATDRLSAQRAFLAAVVQ